MKMPTILSLSAGTFAVPSRSSNPFSASPFQENNPFMGDSPFQGGNPFPYEDFEQFTHGVPFEGMENFFGAFFIGMLVFWLVVGLVLSILSLICMWRLFKKAGQPGWKAIIPIYNSYVMLRIAGCPGWWLALYFVPYVNLVVPILAADAFVKAYGRLGIGPVLMYIFLTPFYLPYLAFSRNVQYVGPFPWGSGAYGGPANAFADPFGPGYQAQPAGGYGPGNGQGYGPGTAQGYMAGAAQGYGLGYVPGNGQGYMPETAQGYGPGTGPGYGTTNSPANFSSYEQAPELPPTPPRETNTETAIVPNPGSTQQPETSVVPEPTHTEDSPADESDVKSE